MAAFNVLIFATKDILQSPENNLQCLISWVYCLFSSFITHLFDDFRNKPCWHSTVPYWATKTLLSQGVSGKHVNWCLDLAFRAVNK